MARRVALSGVLTAVALALAYLESLFPIQAVIPLPGVRLGLANIVTLFALLGLGKREAFFILSIRCVLQAAMFGSVVSFCFSITGGLLAWLVMLCLVPNYNIWFSIIGISVAGATAHQFGQICCASIFFQTTSVFSYLPVLFIVGGLSGFLTGFIAILLFPKLKRLGLYSIKIK